MLTVYVCDDHIEQAEHHCRIINRFLLFSNWDIAQAKAFASPVELLQEIAGSPHTGLYFLDIELESDMDGFALAKKIREADPRGFLVFLTAYSQYTPLAFQHRVEAMDYIVKDHSDTVKERMISCVNEAYQRYQNSLSYKEKTICLKAGGLEIKLPQKDILFLTTTDIPHQIKVCTTDSILSAYAKLRDLEPQLDANFIRIHKSCIVNRDFVTELDSQKRQVILKNGSRLPVAVRCWKNIAL